MTRSLAYRALTPVLALAFILLAVSVSPARPHPAQQTLGHFQDLPEGRAADVAAPAAHTDATDRAWIANGRVRWSIRIGDAQRQTGEDRVFETGSPSFSGRQGVLAVEYDDVNDRLVTLTEAIIEVENGPTLPIPTRHTFDLLADSGGTSGFKKIHALEDLLDVKLWVVGADTRVFVLTTKRIISFLYAGNSIQYQGFTKELFTDAGIPSLVFLSMSDATTDFNDLDVRVLNKMRIGVDENGMVMAYVLAEALGIPATARPRPRIVMACHLNPGNNYQVPTFDADPSPTGIAYVYFNPIPPGTSHQTGASGFRVGSSGFRADVTRPTVAPSGGAQGGRRGV